ncbi:ABC transporter substrate-binding protein [Actinomadura sp. KC216]|uniref:ABC transporter substrate-binding protein n=1 Tax=Actinomadura sp. KC216 TaxID=2530370 RepID=UPI0014052B9C|nr:ABC transporter substrate-binding protein [Actinomadura sp. KC216]
MAFPRPSKPPLVPTTPTPTTTPSRTSSNRPPDPSRRKLTAAVVALMVFAPMAASCARDGTEGSGPVTILANWFPQAELGGYFHAAEQKPAEGSEERPIKVLPGGPGIQTIPQVAAGKAVFGVATGADDLLVARREGLPIVAVFAPFRANITCLTAHASSGVKGFADLDGRKVARVQSRPWWEYLKRHYKLDRVQEINYTGSLAAFKKDKGLVQQCYVTSEPFYLKRDGVPVTTLSISDQGGYAAYSNVLFTTEQTIKRDPELVKSVVERVARGWEAFRADPAVGKQAIVAANKDTDPGVVDFAAQVMRSGRWVSSPPGAMTEAQWLKIRDQVAEAGLVPGSTDVKGAFTTQFLPTQ